MSDSKLKDSFRNAGYHVSPYGYIENLEDFLFGFNSKKQARAWFYDDKVLRFLHDKGFNVIICKGLCIHGNSQSCIEAFTSKIVEEISILDYFGINEKV